MRFSARSGSAIQTWSAGSSRSRSSAMRSILPRTGMPSTVAAGESRIVVVEPAHVESAPRRGLQPPRDLAAMRARADDDDVAEIAPAPPQCAQRDPHRARATRRARESRRPSRRAPIRAKTPARSWSGTGTRRRDGDGEPREQQRAHLLREADAALRLVELQRRKRGKREQRDGEQRRSRSAPSCPSVSNFKR